MKILKKRKRGGILNLIYEASRTLIPTPHKMQKNITKLKLILIHETNSKILSLKAFMWILWALG